MNQASGLDLLKIVSPGGREGLGSPRLWLRSRPFRASSELGWEGGVGEGRGGQRGVGGGLRPGSPGAALPPPSTPG